MRIANVLFAGFITICSTSMWAQSVVDDRTVATGVITFDRPTVWNYKNLTLQDGVRIVLNGHTFVLNVSENLEILGRATIQSFPDEIIDGVAQDADIKPAKPQGGVAYERGPDTQGQGPGISGRHGGDGVNGQPGAHGEDGVDGPTVSIMVVGRAEGELEMLNRGSDARHGSPGGDASSGGNGEQGGRARNRRDWLGIYWCVAGGAQGGNGGNAGSGGAGGNGGTAGDGGITNFTVLGDTSNFQLTVSVREGAFGGGASRGLSGGAGLAGYGGRGAAGCSDEINKRKGRDGRRAASPTSSQGISGEEGVMGNLVLNGVTATIVD